MCDDQGSVRAQRRDAAIQEKAMQNTEKTVEQERDNPAPTWKAPTFTEVKMDAEIGAYQTDFDFDERR
jgi:hypothetical protein